MPVIERLPGVASHHDASLVLPADPLGFHNRLQLLTKVGIAADRQTDRQTGSAIRTRPQSTGRQSISGQNQAFTSTDQQKLVNQNQLNTDSQVTPGPEKYGTMTFEDTVWSMGGHLVSGHTTRHQSPSQPLDERGAHSSVRSL